VRILNNNFLFVRGIVGLFEIYHSGFDSVHRATTSSCSVLLDPGESIVSQVLDFEDDGMSLAIS
jgi:hypothetical protein